MNLIPLFSLERQRKVNNTMCFGAFDILSRNVFLYLRSIKWSCGHGNDGLTHEMMIKKISDTLRHEILHAVIQNQLEKDRYTGTFDPEWPMLNGFDKDYRRVMRMMRK